MLVTNQTHCVHPEWTAELRERLQSRWVRVLSYESAAYAAGANAAGANGSAAAVCVTVDGLYKGYIFWLEHN